ncbi:hypothetical protein B7P43_G05795 [Cryptotermes secundus]|uniref:Mos1 transposase HTH domain-containing protein n=1 Tax=Cryptotermes secundus TaxID=105785 RepID=A0A2J7PNB6_9NEOP|nr:hypothetical protein B7P43_G05795 [Cryptotermes secundus]
MTGLSSPATVMAILFLQCVFKMAMSIQNPTRCEAHAVIRFLHVKGNTAAVIHRHLISFYGEDVNRQNVARWYCQFEVRRSDVHDEIRSGRPSVVTDEIIQKNDENICADRRLTIDELHLQCPEMARTVLSG